MRFVRTLVLSALVGGAASLAHVLGGGGAPHLIVIAALALIGSPLVWVLTARKLTFVQTLTLLGVGQLVGHATMSVASPLASPSGLGGAHSHSTQVTFLGSPGLAGFAMLAAHITMSVLLAIAFSCAERALHWVVTFLGAVIGALITPLTLWARPTLALPGAALSVIVTRWRGMRAPPFVAAS